MNEEMYAFLLDFFPLVAEVSYQDPVLGATLQQAGWRMALENISANDEVEILLKLSFDLGYVSNEVYTFLIRQVKSL